MKQLKLLSDNNEYVFSIKDIKFLLGNNLNTKYSIINNIHKCCISFKDSEYSAETNNAYRFELDGSTINSKNSKFFSLNYEFNIDDEIKIPSKSLTKLYIESLLNDIEYDENVFTINSLIDEFNSSYFEDKATYELLELVININPFNSKSLIKFLSLTMLYEGLEINNFDLSFEQKLLIQCEMIKSISSSNINTDFFIYIDLPILDDSTLNVISSMMNTNVYILISTCLIKPYVSPDNILVVSENGIFDLYLDTVLYDKFILELGLGNNLFELNEALNAINNSDEVVKYQFYNRL